MKRRYRITVLPDYPMYLLQVLDGEASGDYPDHWSYIGRYDTVPEAKEAAEARSRRLDHIERINAIPPEEFEA